MTRKTHRNRTALQTHVSIPTHDDAQTHWEVAVVQFRLFQHSDRDRSSNFYCVYKHPVNGKHLTFSCKTSDKTEAHVYAERNLPVQIQRALNPRDRGRSPAANQNQKTKRPAPIRLQDFFDRYLDEHRTKNGRPLRTKSRDAIRDSFNQFVKRVGNLYLHTITSDECRTFVWSGHPSDRTAEKHWVNLRASFRRAVKEGHLPTNPFDDVTKPSPQYSDEEVEARCFHEADFVKLLEHLPMRTFSQRRLRRMLILCNETGLRQGELRHVKFSWIEPHRHCLRIKSDDMFRPKTPSSSRPVPLSDLAIAVIEEQKQDNLAYSIDVVRSSPYVFPSMTGQPISQSTLINPFRKIRDQIFTGYKPRIHGLRHAFVTRLDEGGMEDRHIQEITGHSSIRMIRRYSHTRERLIEPARDVLNRSRPIIPGRSESSSNSNT